MQNTCGSYVLMGYGFDLSIVALQTLYGILYSVSSHTIDLVEFAIGIQVHKMLLSVSACSYSIKISFFIYHEP